MTCTTCGKESSLKCSGCSEQPYCSKECQAADWKHHKKICKTKKIEHAVLRAADLLQQVFYIFREKTFDQNIVKIEDLGDRLIVHDGDNFARPNGGYFHPFPNHLMKNERDKRAVLSMLMCNEPQGLFHDFLKEMLGDVDVTIDEVTLDMKPPSRNSVIYQYGINSEQDMTKFYHEVLYVRSNQDHQKWIVDITGAEYDIAGAVFDVFGSQSYFTKYTNCFTDIQHFGFSEAYYKGLATFPGNAGIIARVGWDAIAKFNQALQDWKAKEGQTLPQLLRLPKAKFEAKQTTFLKSIADAFEDFVAKADYGKELKKARAYDKRHPGHSPVFQAQLRKELRPIMRQRVINEALLKNGKETRPFAEILAKFAGGAPVDHIFF